jgi:prepilin-type processing-associated H-X9-DG protein
MANASGSPIVFASAAGDGSASSGGGSNASGRVDGYCILTPPQLTGPMWQTTQWKKGASPASYGNVDARYNGKAVCAFLDGSVKAMGIEELRDMRLWSRGAIEKDNSKYTVTVSTGGGRL